MLTFAPLPVDKRGDGAGASNAFAAELERRFEAYKAKGVKPFFREHFARLDRQVVLVDVLGAIHDGPRAVEATRQTMADILGAFRPGRNAFLTSLFAGRRVDRILVLAAEDEFWRVQLNARRALVVLASEEPERALALARTLPMTHVGKAERAIERGGRGPREYFWPSR